LQTKREWPVGFSITAADLCVIVCLFRGGGHPS
jgi:hypothetical protein